MAASGRTEGARFRGATNPVSKEWRARAFAATVTLAPLPLLFPPPFIHNVILPFTRAIGAWNLP